MTHIRLAVATCCALILCSSGCRFFDRRPREVVADDAPYPLAMQESARLAALDQQSVPPATRAESVASGKQRAPSPPAKLAAPRAGSVERVQYELPGDPPADVQYELLDPAPQSAFEPPPYDFLASLSPGARSLYDDAESCYEPPSRLAVTGSMFRNDLRYGWRRMKCDYRNYYSWNNLGMLTAGFGLGAIVANTNLDQEIQDWYQEDVVSTTSDDFARWAKLFGEGELVLAAAATGWLAGEVFYDRPLAGAFGEWGGRSIRGAAVGAPPMLLMQVVTGASRPNEHRGSGWHPFEDNNGVSGHSFVGALPFITAAKMSENVPLKLGFYACSFGAGWSRINDNAHYTSQVLLGWWMAYCAATAVDLTNRGQYSQWSVATVAMGDGAVMSLVYTY